MTVYSIFKRSSELVLGRSEGYHIVGPEWFYHLQPAISTYASAKRCSFDLRHQYNQDGQHIQVVITGTNLTFANGMPASGTITEISLYDVDGITLLQQVIPSEPVSFGLFNYIGSDTLGGFYNLTQFSQSVFGGDDLIIGHDANDHLYGSTGYDTILGGSGDDWLSVGRNLDFMTTVPLGLVDGGNGNDNIFIDLTSDRGSIFVSMEGIETTEGVGVTPSLWIRNVENATILLGWGNNTVIGSLGNDNLIGGYLADILNSGEGDDSIRGNNGNDVIHGGAGNDWLDGGAGDDLIDGGEGDDLLKYASPDDWQFYSLNSGIDILDGGAGFDQLNVWLGDTNVAVNLDLRLASSAFGAIQNDGVIIRNIEYSNISTGAGSDTIFGTIGNDGISTGDGNDSIDGGDGDDRMDGMEGDDTLLGGDGNDRLHGYTGDDVLIGGNGDDIVYHDPSDKEANVQGGNGFDILMVDGTAAPFSFDLARQGFERAEVTEYTTDQTGRFSYSVTLFNADWSVQSASGRDFSGNYWEHNTSDDMPISVLVDYPSGSAPFGELHSDNNTIFDIISYSNSDSGGWQ